MSFTIKEHNGYEEGKRYTKKLKYVSHYGNSRTRYVVFKDEEGNELHWTTRDTNKTYQNFQMKANYTFTVDYIIDQNKHVNIRHVKLPKEAYIVK